MNAFAILFFQNNLNFQYLAAILHHCIVMAMQQQFTWGKKIKKGSDFELSDIQHEQNVTQHQV